MKPTIRQRIGAAGRRIAERLATIELELFREFERAELRRLETRRDQVKRPRATTDVLPRR